MLDRLGQTSKFPMLIRFGCLWIAIPLLDWQLCSKLLEPADEVRVKYRILTTVCCIACGALALAATGCSNSSATEPVSVSGTVSIEGTPLPYGVVEFQSQDNEALNRLAPVNDGKFTADESLGLVAGPYDVRILPYEPEVEELAEIPVEKRRAINAARKLIPERYQKAGELNAELSADSANQLAFNLQNPQPQR